MKRFAPLVALLFVVASGGDLKAQQPSPSVGIPTPDIAIGDLTWFEPDARLHLFGNDLYVLSLPHDFALDEDVVVDAEGGEIIWLKRGSFIKIR